MALRIVFLLIAVFMAYRSWVALRAEHSAVHSIRLGFWLTMLAWMVTRVQILGFLAAGLLGLSILTWAAPRWLPRRDQSKRRPRIKDAAGEEAAADAGTQEELKQLKDSLADLPLAKRIAELPEEDVYPYLDRDETSLRLAAAERLRTVATANNASRVVELLHGESRETDEGVRLKLALVLAKWERREALPVLATALHPDRPGRFDALAALVQLGARQYIPEVLNLAEREKASVGTANAVHTVLHLGGGEELLARRWRGVLRRYAEGVADLLPAGADDARGVIDLLRDSKDQEHRQIAQQLEELLAQG